MPLVPIPAWLSPFALAKCWAKCPTAPAIYPGFSLTDIVTPPPLHSVFIWLLSSGSH